MEHFEVSMFQIDYQLSSTSNEFYSFTWDCLSLHAAIADKSITAFLWLRISKESEMVYLFFFDCK